MPFGSVRLTWTYPGSRQNHYKDHYSAPMAQCAKTAPRIRQTARRRSPASSASYLSSRAAFFITRGFITIYLLKLAMLQNRPQNACLGDWVWAEALSRLRRFPVQGVDFLAADVAQRQRGIVGGEASPRAERPGS